RRRAMLRAYLGYATGSGTTTAMLDEARRRAGRGTDVVVASYRVHGDPRQALAGLDVLGGLRDAPSERALEVDAVLARNPEGVCIDDPPGPGTDGAMRIGPGPRLVNRGKTVLGPLPFVACPRAGYAVPSLFGAPPKAALNEDEVPGIVGEV